jgi:hypothetical protein
MLDVLSKLRTPLVGVGLVALILWLLEGASSFQECIHKEQGQTAPYNFQNNIPGFSVSFGLYRDCIGAFFGAHHNEIIAAFTVLLALVTIFLWLATRALVKGAENTAKRQLRAYVWVKEVFIANLDGPDRPNIQVTIKNWGQTPAYKFSCSGAIKIAPFPNADFSRDPNGDQRVAVLMIPPGGDVGFVTDIPVPLDQIKDALKAGKSAIYAFGSIEYIDAFKKPHAANFRYIFGGDVGTRTFQREGKRFGALAQATEGNSAEDK